MPIHYKPFYKHQAPHQVVDTRDWAVENPTYEEGARTKSALYSPERAPYPFLKPDYRYLSKKSAPRGPVQFWMEIVAYRLGCIIGVPVPPYFVSIAKDGSCRALSEWFFEENKTIFSPAYSLLSRIDKNLDKEKGRLHTYELVKNGLNYLKGMEKPLIDFIEEEHGQPVDSFIVKNDFPKELITILTFDALIGNTDRHHENWGILFYGLTGADIRIGGKNYNSPQPILTLAPAFDNGTSLGYDRPENKIGNFIKDPNWFAAFVRKGTHHIRDAQTGKNMPHADLIIKFLTDFPAYDNLVHELISFDLSDVETMLRDLTAFDIPVPFTQTRADFTLKIIEAKQTALKKALKL